MATPNNNSQKPQPSSSESQKPAFPQFTELPIELQSQIFEIAGNNIFKCQIVNIHRTPWGIMQIANRTEVAVEPAWERFTALGTVSPSAAYYVNGILSKAPGFKLGRHMRFRRRTPASKFNIPPGLCSWHWNDILRLPNNLFAFAAGERVDDATNRARSQARLAALMQGRQIPPAAASEPIRTSGLELGSKYCIMVNLTSLEQVLGLAASQADEEDARSTVLPPLMSAWVYYRINQQDSILLKIFRSLCHDAQELIVLVDIKDGNQKCPLDHLSWAQLRYLWVFTPMASYIKNP